MMLEKCVSCCVLIGWLVNVVTEVTSAVFCGHVSPSHRVVHSHVPELSTASQCPHQQIQFAVLPLNCGSGFNDSAPPSSMSTLSSTVHC